MASNHGKGSSVTIVGRRVSSLAGKVLSEVRTPDGDRVRVLSKRTFDKASKRAGEALRKGAAKKT